jgi:hypothetical protein
MVQNYILTSRKLINLELDVVVIWHNNTDLLYEFLVNLIKSSAFLTTETLKY